MLAGPESQVVEQGPHAGFARRAAKAVHRAVEADVLGDGEVVVEPVALRHVPDPAPHAFRVVTDVDPGDHRPASRWFEQPAQHPDRRGLPRPVRPEEPEHLTAVDIEVEAFHRDQ